MFKLAKLFFSVTGILALFSLSFAFSFDLNVYNKKFEEKNGLAEFSFDIAQDPGAYTDSLYYSLRIQKGSDILFETEPKEIKFDRTKKAHVKDSIDAKSNGQVFLLISHPKGQVIYATILGEIKNAPQKDDKVAKLNFCSVSSKEDGKVLVSCSIESPSATTQINVDIYPVESRKTIYSFSIPAVKEKVASESDFVLTPGMYLAKIYIPNSNMLDKTFSVGNDWISISRYSISDFKEGAFVANIIFNGSPTTNHKRGFKWWVLSNADEVCDSGELDLSSMPPYEYKITSNPPLSCSDPRFVGVLYDGVDENGNPIIKDKIGTADFASLVKKDKNVLGSDNLKVSGLIFLALVVFALLYFLYYLIVHKKNVVSGKTWLLLVLLSVPFAGIAARIYTTWDNPNAVLSVEFSKRVYAPEERLGFTFVLSDYMQEKRQKGDLYAKIDSGNYQKVANATALNSNDVFVTYISSLATPKSEGEHTLTLKIPGLCGSAFDYSRFDQSKFGTQDCELSWQFEVREGAGGVCTSGDPACLGGNTPSKPIALGSTCNANNNTSNIRFVSYYDEDNDGIQDSVYYIVRLSDGTDIRVPTTGSVRAGVEQSFSVNLSGEDVAGTITAYSQDGNAASQLAVFRTNCFASTYCGNGKIEPEYGERCDDGNRTNGDGCDSKCQWEGISRCGNNIREPQFGEECDGTDTPAGQVCTPVCILASRCTEPEVEITPNQRFVKRGNSVTLAWDSVPAIAKTCSLYANGRKVLEEAKLINNYTVENIQGETLFELRCQTVCGNSFSATTTVYTAAEQSEQ